MRKHLTTGITLALIFGVALFIRVFPPFKLVFVGDSVRFLEVDPWWHMHIIDNLVHNFPHLTSFDPYFVYPTGGGVYRFPGFDYIVAAIIWVIGLGSPGEGTINAVAAYFPAILGALLTIPVYFIGKVVFNRWVGILSAALIAILPGAFLLRTLLGFTDQHVAEVFLTTLTITFFMLAIKLARQRQMSFSDFRHREWKATVKPLVYSLLAGITLGTYLASWSSGLLFVAILACFLILQFIIDHLRHNCTDYLGITGTLTLLVASGMILPLRLGKTEHIYQASLLLAVALPLVLSAVSRLMASRTKPFYYPLVLAGLGLVSLSTFYFLNPALVTSMVAQVGKLRTATESGLVEEMRPLLFYRGYFSLGLAWKYFTTGFFISLLSLGFLAYLVKKESSAEKSLLLIWSAIILALTLISNRFAYYFAINVAILTGYLSWKALEFAGFRESGTMETAHSPGEKVERHKARLKAKRPPVGGRMKMTLAIVIIVAVVFCPNIAPARATSTGPGAIDDDWYNSLLWLKANTPEPFGDPDYYYQLHEAPPPGKPYEPPPSAYGVVSRREAGYWITRIAHRIPNHNPSGISPAVAFFFASQDELSANKIIENLGAKYVIIDLPLATIYFPSTATFANRELSDFYEVYYQRAQDGSLQPVLLYYPEYYRSITARLYCFDGKAVTPVNSTAVISYQEKSGKDNKPYKEVVSAVRFPSYEAAQAYVTSQGANYRIVGTNPLISPVPLEELGHYKLIYSSEPITPQPGTPTIHFVKIFEYVK